MYVKDFAHNGFVQQIISYYNAGKPYPLTLRDDLTKSLAFLKDRYLNYKDYARQTVADVFPQKDLDDAVVKNAYTFATSLVRNNGDGSFTLVPLPLEAQIAPIYGILAGDFDGDGKTGSAHGWKLRWRQAGDREDERRYGLYLRGDGKGALHAGPGAGKRFSSFPDRRATSSAFAPGRAASTSSRATTIGRSSSAPRAQWAGAPRNEAH